MQKAVWCLCFYGKNLLISGSGDQCIKVMHSNLLSCMCGSEIMTEVTNLSSLACFRSGTSRLGPVNGEITQVHVTRNPMLCLHSCGLVCVHFCVKVHAPVVLSPDPTLSRGETVWWNQVKFLGIVHAFVTITFCGQPAQERYRYSNGDQQILLF